MENSNYLNFEGSALKMVAGVENPKRGLWLADVEVDGGSNHQQHVIGDVHVTSHLQRKRIV